MTTKQEKIDAALAAIDAAQALQQAQQAVIDAAQEVIRTAQDDAPSPTPTPAPTPIPAQAGLLPALPSFAGSSPITGPADWINPATLPAHVPWSVYEDAATQTIARSMNGVEATEFRRLHLYGQASGLYQQTQAIVNGRCKQAYADFGTDDAIGIKNAMPTYPLRAGVRGENIMSPYTTWHGHSRRKVDGTLADTNLRAPLFMGVTWTGDIYMAMRDGSVKKAFGVPVTTWAQDFTYIDPHGPFRDGNILHVTDTGAGKVIRVDKSADPVFALGLAPVCTEFASGLGRADSVRSFGGFTYVTDSDSGHVWKIDEATGAKNVLATVPMAFWVDHTSDDKLVVLTKQQRLYWIDRDTGQVLKTVLMAADGAARPWVQCSVDRQGTWGEIDAVQSIASHGVGNIECPRYSSKGVRGFVTLFGSWGGPCHVGNARELQDPYGHYNWAVEHHPDEAVVMVQGFSNDQPMIIAARNPAAPAWPADVNLDVIRPLYTLGRDMVARYGCGPGTPIGTVPPFTALWNWYGGSHIGLSFDFIAEMSYADAAAFIQAGAGGSTPRPFIKGDDLKALLVYIYRNSQRYLREGKPLITGLMAMNFGTALPPIPQTFPVYGTDIFLRAEKQGGSLKVVGGKPEWPITLPAGLVATITIDKGQPGEVVIDDVVSPWIAPMPAGLAAGPHSLYAQAKTNPGAVPMWGRATVMEL